MVSRRQTPVPTRRSFFFEYPHPHDKMREFHDAAGERWDATIGKQSWGALVLLFAPRAGGEARTTLLSAETMLEAERELAALSDEELRERLEASEPWG